MSYVVGLTGGIGSGKSAVADCFETHGVAVVDTDRIAHQLTAADGAAIAPIRQAFGAAVIDPRGALDRAAMRRHVFSDTAARQRLEAILHPMIRSEAERLCLAADSAYVILVVPLLIETGAYRDRIRRIVVVDCPEAIQLARVMQRSGLSAGEVGAIMAAQASRSERLARADDVIDNSGALSTLPEQVAALHRNYLETASVS